MFRLPENEDDPAPGPSLDKLWRRGLLVLLALTGLVYLWICTDRSWRIFERQDFGDIYDHLAIGLMQGRLDLPPDVIGTEAFVIDGRHYGYWAPFPALLRIPLVLTGGSFWVGHTARLMCWLAGIISLIAACGILGELQRILGWKAQAPGFTFCYLVALALGSHIPYLLASPSIYSESVLWATAMALLAMQQGLVFVRSETFLPLLVAVSLAGASALTRATTGYGALIGISGLIAWFWWNSRKSPVGAARNRTRWQFWFLAGLTVFFVSLPLCYNYVRFGSFVRLPYDKHLSVEPWRVEITKHGNFQPVNLWPNARAYFDPTHIDVRPGFPYFHLSAYQPQPGARIEHAEAYAGIPAFMTGLCVLAVLGLQGVQRDRRITFLLLGGGATLFAILAFTAVAHRYGHDLFPLGVLLSASGALWLGQRQGRIPELARSLTMLLLVVGIWQSAALAYYEQEWARSWAAKNPYRMIEKIPTVE